MKAQSTTQPSTFHVGVANRWATISLRENITQKQRETDTGAETYYEFDEYRIQLRDRENINNFVQTNFTALLNKAKEQTGNELFALCNRQVGEYIYSKYDQGTQSSFLSLHADPATPIEAKAAIESVWVWIRTVMAYYYGIKAQLTAGTVVQWDFQQFDASDPQVKLSDFMSM